MDGKSHGEMFSIGLEAALREMAKGLCGFADHLSPALTGSPAMSSRSKGRASPEILTRSVLAALRSACGFRFLPMKNSPFCNGEVKAVVSLSSPDCPPGL
jgi:hypothetical protein